MDGSDTPTDACAHMGVRCGAGVSTQPDLSDALDEARAQAHGALGTTGTADLALVFISKAYGDSISPIMEHLSECIPASVVLGTTVEGVLAGGLEYEGGFAVTVWLATLPKASLVPLALDYTQTADGGSFIGWPQELDGSWPSQASLLILADPFSFPMDQLLRQLHEDHPDVTVVGGMASGGNEPGCNRLVMNTQSYDAGAVGVIIGDNVRIRTVVSQGCRPLGRPFVITKAESNVIIELGGKPALDQLRGIYADLSHEDQILIRTSLHIGYAANEYQDSFHHGDFLVRTIAGADPDSGVLAVGDIVRTGQTVQFHVRDATSAHDDLASLLTKEKERGIKAAGGILFSCNGRGSRLFGSHHHDAACLQELFGPLPVTGFFAQGEIGPIGNRAFVHGFTASIALFETT